MATIRSRLASFFKGKADTQPLPTVVQPGTFGMASLGGKSGPAAPRVHFDAIYSAIKRHSDTNACFRVLMNSVGKAGYDFASTDPDDEEPPEAAVNAANDVLLGIDRTQSFGHLIRTVALHINAAGNDFWVIKRNGVGGQAIGLAHLHPKTARVAIDPYGKVKAYLQEVPGSEPKVFPPEDVIWFPRFPDPEDDAYSMGPMQAVLSELEADQKAAATNLNVLNNDMKIPMIFMLDKDTGEQQFQAMAETLRQQYSGYQNGGKALISSGVTDVRNLTPTFTDMQFIDLRRLSTEKVCATLGIPKSVIGYRDSSNEASAGKVDRVTMYEDTIRPQEEAIAEVINNDLFPKCGIQGIKFEFNYSSSAEAEIVAASTREDLKNGVRTINELRYERGLEPLDATLYPLAEVPMISTASGPIPLDQLALNDATAEGLASATPEPEATKRLDAILREMEELYP